jgi:hypothetical protein
VVLGRRLVDQGFKDVKPHDITELIYTNEEELAAENLVQ